MLDCASRVGPSLPNHCPDAGGYPPAFLGSATRRRLQLRFLSRCAILRRQSGGSIRLAAAIARRQAQPYPADRLVELLRAQQQQRHAPPEALAATDRLKNPRTVAVVTGQQAGLFGGPFFTLLKAITAIRLADRVAREHKVPAVAVFWIDAEDHDWDEVRSCRVMDAEQQRREVSLPPRRGGDQTPAGTVRLDVSIEAALDTLASVLAPSEFTQPLVADLRAIYRPGARFVEAFGRWLEAALGRRGLIVFDGSDGEGKPLASQLFDRELRTAGRTSTLAAASGAELVTLGYHAQVTPQPDGVALFYLDGLDGARQPIRLKGNDFAVGETPVAASALLSEAAAEPTRFSPNVLLRPLVQDTLFPTVCYVSGPNELAYLTQLKEIYAHFSVPMPLMYPRATATIIDTATAKFLARYDFPLRGASTAGRGRAQPLARIAASLVGRTIPRRSDTRRGGSDGGPRRRGGCHRSDARRSGTVGARKDGARTAHPAGQDHPGGQAA